MKIGLASCPIEPVLVPIECYTKWPTGVASNPNYSMYANYKARSMTLGMDVTIRHPRTTRHRKFDDGNRTLHTLQKDDLIHWNIRIGYVIVLLSYAFTRYQR